ncbi:VTC domain-containing protein [Adhaeribacter rhizoryzae]|uniref:VTC domain-containing protein n=1 Tax=Adhaeribacter rhizoryzae TaxID=2607907 RepID=A0A5M6DLI6_9BACT|nr:VTC domain-containing protein [Adhaeribacter rhizoryzae]KAA5548313.1 VTC domain-containing protein [Adhaeribacter rhizoryzae]
MKSVNKKLGLDKFRYERKYLIEGISFAEVKLACQLHPKGFRPVFHPRTINNIYFDTFGFKHYADNVEGNQQRLKVRIRWYGNLFGEIKKPVLELKIKEGLLGIKKSYKLNPFVLDKNFSKDSILDALNRNDVPVQIKKDLASLQPAILNQYHRHYYLSFDRKFRITIDQKMNYHRISYHNPLFLENSHDRNTLIMELKYAHGADQEAREVSALFPFPLTKSSKYVQGLERLFL